MKLLISAFLLVVAVSVFGQDRFSFKPTTQYHIIKNGDSLKLGYAGGLNEAQFSTIDLNGDGKQDVVTFDRAGDRILTFLQKDINGTPEYRYAPEYRDSFPDIHHWMLLVDYNCDGKKDIFCYASGGIGVYENTSSGGGLSFQWALPLHNLRSDYGLGKTNLHIYNTDLPGLADVDFDGDIDVFSFSFGNTLQWHENTQPCGLDFHLNTWCWGRFEEGALDNNLTFDACQGLMKYGYPNPPISNINKTKHAGSTSLMLNLNGDTLMDLLIGDVSFANGVAGFNTGRRDSAFISAQDTTFPAYNTPADVYIFPAFFYEDIDFDSKKDLIVAPNIFGGKTVNGIWWYKNTNTNDNPTFSFQDTSLFQRDMVDLGEGAIPVLVDIDYDGLLDLFVSNFGQLKNDLTYKSYITYYKNTGTAQNPQFTWVTSDFEGASALGQQNLIPAFADLDGDVDIDMVIGALDGKLYYYENTGGITTPSFTFRTANWQGIDVGNAAAPHFFDIDEDGDADLFIGEEDGTINYYSNDGNNPPTFALESEEFGGVNVHSQTSVYGYSLPVFYRRNDSLTLFVGSPDQGVQQFDSIEAVMALPSVLNATLGSGNISSSDYNLTPFGAEKRNGRNQMLIKASELKAAGLVYGKITDISFKVTNNPSNYLSQGFTIKMKNADLPNGLSGWETDLTEVYDYIYPVNNGWNTITLFHPFYWDGESDLVVELCFSKNSPNYNIDVELTDVGYPANAYGDVDNWNQITQDGCQMPFLNVDNKRPNMKIKMIPTFIHVDSPVKDGYRNMPAVGNLNYDDYPDMILGNLTGGITFLKGKKYTSSIGVREFTITDGTLSVYPNPTQNRVTIEIPKELNQKKTKIMLYDLAGRVMMTQKAEFANETTVNLSSLSTGVYIVTVSDEERSRYARVIKQ